MIIGLTQEQRDRVEAAVQTYFNEMIAITAEITKDCKTGEDLEMSTAILRVAIDQANKKAEENMGK